jgi:hypothetical protein
VRRPLASDALAAERRSARARTDLFEAAAGRAGECCAGGEGLTRRVRGWGGSLLQGMSAFALSQTRLRRQLACIVIAAQSVNRLRWSKTTCSQG